METEPQTHESPKNEAGDFVVSRDCTFSRHVADRTLVFYLGRDIEISFMQSGPNILGYRVQENSGRTYKLDPMETEVSRVRMTPPSALQLAINIITDLISEDEIHKDKLLEAISAIPAPEIAPED